MADQTRDKRPTTWVTWLILAACVAMFGIELAKGADPLSPTPRQILDLGVTWKPLTIDDGQYWRLFASMFLHYGVIHIAMNMYFLYVMRGVEVVYGHARFAVIYVLAGLVGALAATFVTPTAPIAGASGALFGLFGAYASFLLLRRKRFEPARWQAAMKNLGMNLVLNLVIGVGVPGISLSSHAFGFGAGVLLGAALLPRA